MATSNLNDLTQERMSNFDQLIEHLYEFYFENRKGQYLIYALTFLISVAYASIGILALGRAEQSVVFDCVVLAIIFLVGLPVAYNLGVVYADADTQASEPMSSGQAQSVSGATVNRGGSAA
jgi:hypothetical protein